MITPATTRAPPTRTASRETTCAHPGNPHDFFSAPILASHSPHATGFFSEAFILSLSQLFTGTGYTYSDYIILPGHIAFAAHDVNLRTLATKRIALNAPFVSSPMDTVTEAQMAIHMALFGGLGIIHCNNMAEEQCDEVRRVKRFENGFILDPFTVSPSSKLADLDAIKAEHGFSGCPVTEDGKMGGKLVGIVTTRDHDFVKDRDTLISEVMTKEVVTALEGCSLEEANNILKDSKKGKLPVVDSNGCLVAAISRKDLRKNRDFPYASKDSSKRLLVGASVHTRPEDKERVAMLVEAGVDVIVIDSSQGNSTYQMDMVKWLKTTYPDIQVVGGNVVCVSQAQNLIEWGVDAIRIGMGSGSICTTQEVMAVGRPQAGGVPRLQVRETARRALLGGWRHQQHRQDREGAGVRRVVRDDGLAPCRDGGGAGRLLLQGRRPPQAL